MEGTYLVLVLVLTCCFSTTCDGFFNSRPTFVVSRNKIRSTTPPIIVMYHQNPSLQATRSSNEEPGGDPRGSHHGLGRISKIRRSLTRFLHRFFPSRSDVVSANPISADAKRQEEQPLVTRTIPQGSRWAVSANDTDLSGMWKPIITDAFKSEYDEYLKNCSQSFVYRKVILSVMGLAEERIEQCNNGRQLIITATSPVSDWQRTLVASGSNLSSADFEPVNVTFKDPDGDMVQVEACWARNGTVHKSWLRGKPRVLGGEFETSRYLASDGAVLICESTFNPSNSTHRKGFKKGFVKWRYQRVQPA
mmetsp:Transcript_19217/g.31919  ORF Transcript_19217/g.31919 Transcript_19217/m.31919 type:complete len:306 (-) Transcript_19217:134-1051(-)